MGFACYFRRTGLNSENGKRIICDGSWRKINVGEKALAKTGKAVEILTEEIKTEDLALDANGNLFVDSKNNLGTETVIVQRVRFLDGLRKGKETPVSISDLYPIN